VSADSSADSNQLQPMIWSGKTLKHGGQQNRIRGSRRRQRRTVTRPERQRGTDSENGKDGACANSCEGRNFECICGANELGILPNSQYDLCDRRTFDEVWQNRGQYQLFPSPGGRQAVQAEYQLAFFLAYVDQYVGDGDSANIKECLSENGLDLLNCLDCTNTKEQQLRGRDDDDIGGLAEEVFLDHRQCMMDRYQQKLEKRLMEFVHCLVLYIQNQDMGAHRRMLQLSHNRSEPCVGGCWSWKVSLCDKVERHDGKEMKCRVQRSVCRTCGIVASRDSMAARCEDCGCRETFEQLSRGTKKRLWARKNSCKKRALSSSSSEADSDCEASCTERWTREKRLKRETQSAVQPASLFDLGPQHRMAEQSVWAQSHELSSEDFLVELARMEGCAGEPYISMPRGSNESKATLDDPWQFTCSLADLVQRRQQHQSRILKQGQLDTNVP